MYVQTTVFNTKFKTDGNYELCKATRQHHRVHSMTSPETVDNNLPAKTSNIC